MITHLQELYDEQSQTALGQSIHNHYLLITKDLKELEKLEMTMHKELHVLVMQ